MPSILLLQTAVLLLFWYYCFRHKAWQRGWFYKILLFLLPFAFGCLLLWWDIHYLSLETLRSWHNAFCCFSTLTALLLLPQWYKLMWLALLALPVQKISESTKLMFTIFIFHYYGSEPSSFFSPYIFFGWIVYPATHRDCAALF